MNVSVKCITKYLIDIYNYFMRVSYRRRPGIKIHGTILQKWVSWCYKSNGSPDLLTALGPNTSWGAWTSCSDLWRLYFTFGLLTNAECAGIENVHNDVSTIGHNTLIVCARGFSLYDVLLFPLNSRVGGLLGFMNGTRRHTCRRSSWNQADSGKGRWL